MISDILSDAVGKIDQYINEPIYHKVYFGEERINIINLRNEMDKLRIRLDELPFEDGINR